ncbi:unnamed protein product [Amoebophrya sp. A25]|nr:unnamed protein product [Amoebophrya sp. A25]|eukprot:GSA25T00013038001.1
MQKYKLTGYISEGRFGSVSKACLRDGPDHELVAIKEVYFREAGRRLAAGGQIVMEECDAWTKSIIRELQFFYAEENPGETWKQLGFAGNDGYSGGAGGGSIGGIDTAATGLLGDAAGLFCDAETKQVLVEGARHELASLSLEEYLLGSACSPSSPNGQHTRDDLGFDTFDTSSPSSGTTGPGGRTRGGGGNSSKRKTPTNPVVSCGAGATVDKVFFSCSASSRGEQLRSRQYVHPNIIRLIDHFRSDTQPCHCLVYEYCEADLGKVSGLSELQVKRLTLQLLTGLQELHVNRKVMHRDLKPGNLLLHRDGLLKIADFGSACRIPNTSAPAVAATGTMATGGVGGGSTGGVGGLSGGLSSSKVADEILKNAQQHSSALGSTPLCLIGDHELEATTKNEQSSPTKSTPGGPSSASALDEVAPLSCSTSSDDGCDVPGYDARTGLAVNHGRKAEQANPAVDNLMLTREICTRWYKSVELLYGSFTYDEKIDIWAVGCIVFELLNDRPLFNGDCDIEQLGKIFHSLGTVDTTEWPGVRDLPDWNKIQFWDIDPPPNQYMQSKPFCETSGIVRHCIRLNPAKRADVGNLLLDPWFAGAVTEDFRKDVIQIIRSTTAKRSKEVIPVKKIPQNDKMSRHVPETLQLSPGEFDNLFSPLSSSGGGMHGLDVDKPFEDDVGETGRGYYVEHMHLVENHGIGSEDGVGISGADNDQNSGVDYDTEGEDDEEITTPSFLPGQALYNLAQLKKSSVPREVGSPHMNTKSLNASQFKLPLALGGSGSAKNTRTMNSSSTTGGTGAARGMGGSTTRDRVSGSQSLSGDADAGVGVLSVSPASSTLSQIKPNPTGRSPGGIERETDPDGGDAGQTEDVSPPPSDASPSFFSSISGTFGKMRIAGTGNARALRAKDVHDVPRR